MTVWRVADGAAWAWASVFNIPGVPRACILINCLRLNDCVDVRAWEWGIGQSGITHVSRHLPGLQRK